MREIAGHDYDMARRVARWPVREGLLAYLEQMKAQLRVGLRHNQLLYQIRVQFLDSKQVAKIKVPEIPALLRERKGK